jgi:hypothetical protein
MDGLLIWYLVVLCGLLVAIREPKPKKPQRSQAREWLAQLVASSDPMPDYLYDPDQSKPMELMTDGRAHQKQQR